jgi:hypothetical protein
MRSGWVYVFIAAALTATMGARSPRRRRRARTAPAAQAPASAAADLTRTNPADPRASSGANRAQQPRVPAGITSCRWLLR